MKDFNYWEWLADPNEPFEWVEGMNIPVSEEMKKKRKELRQHMTPEENHLWYDFLRGYSKRFVRQKVVGNYILDFYCAEKKLAIEIDGSQLTRTGGSAAPSVTP